MLEWIKANPELAATVCVAFVLPAFSSAMHAIGNLLDARGFARAGGVFHWIAMRTPRRLTAVPTTKAGVIALAQQVVAEAAEDTAAVTPRNSGTP